jgi:RNA polymerase sigma factor (TIGR02999 family)
MPGPSPVPAPEPAPIDAGAFADLQRELRGIAARMLRRERAGHTLQPTALMHEAWLRLAQVRQPWQNRTHFMSVAASAMRRVLVDHGRARACGKRGAAAGRVTLTTGILGAAAAPDDVLVVDEALERLAALDPKLAQIVELRVFGGLAHPEIAEITGCSLRTIERGWRSARAFLRRALRGDDGA